MSFADADVQKLADTLRKTCDYSPFTEGVYEVNTFTLPDKETWALEKAFKQREYTDEEIQQLASAGLTLEEAADKLHYIEDAALFLRASGYRIDEKDAYFCRAATSISVSTRAVISVTTVGAGACRRITPTSTWRERATGRPT